MRLWDFALCLYGRPGVEAACLTLQDDNGQCVPLLLWRLWALDRHVDFVTLRSAVVVAGHWDGLAVVSLRAVRRGLAAPTPPIADEDRRSLREAVRAAELAAERLLLETLEAMTPNDQSVGKAAIDALVELADASSRSAPVNLLAVLADAAASVTGGATADRDTAMNDDDASGEDETSSRIALAELRLAHQDFDAAIGALEAGPQADQLRIARLKKRKLGLRDQITKLEERLTPDIIA